MDVAAPTEIEWNLDQRPLKELAALILAERADVVSVVADASRTLGQLERLGYPLDLHQTGACAASGRSRCVLTPLLTRSVLPVRHYDYSVSCEDVEAYGRFSGDMNPVHFDDEAAREQGFEGRISHGMLFNGWLTRLLGMEYPGNGTLYLRSQCLYLAPVYPERAYSIRVSTPRHDPVRNTYLIVAQLLDPARGRHASIAYADVMSRLPRIENRAQSNP
ncbi:MaoC/PaaZ C-terminal domain-containing protein [Lysobacter sp. CCNWLW3]|uniref:MaoC/PaaZ C-terminal domain-containing protein n=1 Tax=unclassified Lysobacter TaxID=2635362 RepID=UPI002FD41335